MKITAWITQASAARLLRKEGKRLGSKVFVAGAASLAAVAWATAVADDELLLAVRFPLWEGQCGFAVEELARRAGDFALVGVVCGVQVGEGGISRAAIALFGVGPPPVRAPEAEQALVGGGA